MSIWWIYVCFISLLISMSQCEIHSLEFLYTVRSKPGDRPQYEQATVFDGIIISHCDSVTVDEELTQNPVYHPWVEENPKWKEKIRYCTDEFWDLYELLSEESAKINSTVDLIQRRSGCSCSSDESISMFDFWGVDGENFLSFNLTSLEWKSESPLILSDLIEKRWNSQSIRKHVLASFLKDDCPLLLRSIMKRREELVNTTTVVYMFTKPIPQSETVSLRCHVRSTDLSVLTVQLTRNGSVMTEGISTMGPLPCGNESVLMRVTAEIPLNVYMTTWQSYRCEVHTSKKNISTLWVDYTLPGRISGRPRAESEISASYRLLFIILTFIVVAVFAAYKCGKTPQLRFPPSVDPELKAWFSRLIADRILKPRIRMFLSTFINGAAVPNDIQQDWMEFTEEEDRLWYDPDFYGQTIRR